MKHLTTCIGCIDKEGKPLIECEVRKKCFDDASTTTRRKQIIHKIPEVKN